MFRHVKPGDGPTQRLKLTERLLDVMNVVDERFVAMTDGELCAAVARYLRQQEGLDVRVRHLPAIDDQRAREQLVVSPRGERYHKGQLLAAAYKLVHGHPPEGVPTDFSVLRQLYLQRGIELPSPPVSDAGWPSLVACRWSAGSVAATAQSAKSQHLLLVRFAQDVHLGGEPNPPQFVNVLFG